MDLVGHVIKSYNARSASQTLWSRNNQIQIPVKFLAFLFITFICILKKTNRSELLKLLRFYSTDQQKEHAMITVTS